MAGIKSPIAGMIIAINVQVGQTITEGDMVITIESMKMENYIFSEKSGTVKEIMFKVGDRVQEDDILAVID